MSDRNNIADENKPIKKKCKKKILISIIAVVVIIALAFAIFPLQIMNFLLSIFVKPAPSNTPDSVLILFGGVDTYIDLPVALQGQTLTPVNHSSYNFTNNTSTSVEDAAALFALGEANLRAMNQWGLFIDVLAEDTSVIAGNYTGKGAVATQFIKIQDNNSFFLNEGFALISFEFLTSGNTEVLSQLLRENVNGGCRILTDTEENIKHLQWVPKNGASYDSETKLISTALLPIDSYPIQEGVLDCEPYDREETFESLLPVDISVDTITSATITYNETDRIYTMECVMNPVAMTASDKSVGTIQNLFGEGLADNIAFQQCTFTVEIWSNGLIKSIIGVQDWSAKLNLSPFFLTTSALDTKTNFYFTYHQDDCSIASIKEKYYKDKL